MPPRFTKGVLVLAGGAPPPGPIFRALAKRAAAVLCADGAYHACLGLGVRPRWVVGDMDSLGDNLSGGTVFVFNDEPDRSDLEKALEFLSSHGCPKAWVAGALGGRLDHSLANLQVLESCAKKMDLVLFDGRQSARVVSGRAVLATRPGDTVSLFPIGRAVVRTAGLRYPLRGERLPAGSRGVSNVATRGRVVVAVLSGRLWLVHGPAEPAHR